MRRTADAGAAAAAEAHRRCIVLRRDAPRVARGARAGATGAQGAAASGPPPVRPAPAVGHGRCMRRLLLLNRTP